MRPLISPNYAVVINIWQKYLLRSFFFKFCISRHTICRVNRSKLFPSGSTVRHHTYTVLFTEYHHCSSHLRTDWGISIAISSLRLHLALNRVHRVHAIAQVPRSDVSRVDEVCRFADHAPVDVSPSFRLWLLSYTTAETEPKLTHARQVCLGVHSCAEMASQI